MLIDWFTIGAQIVNFLILVWVLKHFLYKPILNAIDAREKLIAGELAGAAASKAEALEEQTAFQNKNETFDTQRAALLSKAAADANAERQRLLDEARKAADALTSRRQEAIKNEAHSLEGALTRRTQQEVFAIARKALTDLAATGLEERMGEAFTHRLRAMDGQDKARMGEALKAATPAVVRSAFDLPQQQREALQRAINETFSADIHLRFETAPDLISGIDLSADGRRVGWSIGSYLAALNKSVSALLQEKARAEATTDLAPQIKTVTKPEAAVAPKPDAKIEPKADAVITHPPETTTEPKPKASVVPPHQVKADSQAPVTLQPIPDACVVPNPDAVVTPLHDAHAEPKPVATSGITSETLKLEPQAP